MKKIAKYVLENLSEIEKVSGSFSTFIEKTMTKKQKKFICQNHLKEAI